MGACRDLRLERLALSGCLECPLGPARAQDFIHARNKRRLSDDDRAERRLCFVAGVARKGAAMGSRLEDGHRAERLVARYLVADGWRIIARNVYFRRGELDIVAWERDELVFVEVRSRRSDALVRAVDTVTLKKRRRLLAAASAYLAQRGWYDVNARFDVIGVDSEAWKIVDHVRRAFTSELL